MKAKLPDGTIVEGTPEEVARLVDAAKRQAGKNGAAARRPWRGFYNADEVDTTNLPDGWPFGFTD